MLQKLKSCMKNILVIFFFSPLLLLGQGIDNFLIGYTGGVVQDLYKPKNDINPFSPDTKSKIGDEYNFRFADSKVSFKNHWHGRRAFYRRKILSIINFS